MKKFRIYLSFIAGISLIISCSKSDQAGFDMAGLSLKNQAGSSPVSEAVFIVEPNGVDDTESLIDAFDKAIGHGHGAVVQLIPGNYFLNFIEIREFTGKFRGAGKGRTFISTVEDLSVDEILSQNLNTVLIRFVGGDVNISEMTIMTPPGELSTGSVDYIDGLVGISSITSQYTSENGYINAVVDNVDFAGNWENTTNGLKAESGFRKTIPGGIPLSYIDISITNCSFSGFASYGVLIMEIREGKFIIGTQSKGNLFDNIYYGSLGIWHNVSMDASIEGNSFKNPVGTRFGIELYSSPYPGYLEQVPQSFQSFCNIRQNTFDISGGLGGILVNDRRRYFFPEELPMLFQVKNNLFNMSDGAYTGIGCFNMDGMVIRNNRFAGTGSYGVRIMGPSPYPYNQNGVMLGNNFSNTSYSVTAILLDTRTRNWTIVGGNMGEYITNNGENNIITGFNMNYSEAPVGQTIVDNLEGIRDAIHKLRDQ